MSDEANQREHKRLPVDYPIEYRVPDRDIAGVGRIKDLSDTGVRFEADLALQPGDSVMSIRIPRLRVRLAVRRALVVSGSPASRPYRFVAAFWKPAWESADGESCDLEPSGPGPFLAGPAVRFQGP